MNKICTMCISDCVTMRVYHKIHQHHLTKAMHSSNSVHNSSSDSYLLLLLLHLLSKLFLPFPQLSLTIPESSTLPTVTSEYHKISFVYVLWISVTMCSCVQGVYLPFSALLSLREHLHIGLLLLTTLTLLAQLLLKQTTECIYYHTNKKKILKIKLIYHMQLRNFTF